MTDPFACPRSLKAIKLQEARTTTQRLWSWIAIPPTHLHMQIYFTRKVKLSLVWHRLPMLFVARLLAERPLCALKLPESVWNDYAFSSVQCEYRPITKYVNDITRFQRYSVWIRVQNECALPFCILTRTWHLYCFTVSTKSTHTCIPNVYYVHNFNKLSLMGLFVSVNCFVFN